MPSATSCGTGKDQEIHSLNYRSLQKIRSYIHRWEKRGYPSGIPDEAPSRLEDNGRVPSYRLICAAIMRNDHTLELLGYARPRCELYHQIKHAEIKQREQRRKTHESA